MARVKPIWLALLLLLSAQLMFAHHVRDLRAGIDEMPYPLRGVALKTLAFGDDQFLFRAVARWLQDVGDGGGRVRPLRDYDYTRVVGWLQTLDKLDGQSDYGYVLAAHYFGAVTDIQKVAVIAEYFRTEGMTDPARRWTWLVWAVAQTIHRIKDQRLASSLAKDILSLRGDSRVPDWLLLLVPGLYQTAGETSAAAALERDPAFQDLKRGAAIEQLKKLDNQ